VMYLLPGSKLALQVREKEQIPLSLSTHLMPGFEPCFMEGKGYVHLCQHYEHDEVDIYYYTVQTATATVLFTEAPTKKWVLSYVKAGDVCFHYYDGTPIALSKYGVIFFPTQQGFQVQVALASGSHELICCSFTSLFSAYLFRLYPLLISSERGYPIVIPFIDHAFQQEWQRLLPLEIDVDLYPAFVAAQIRLLLGQCTQTYRRRLVKDVLMTRHPGIDSSVIEKAYRVRDIIHAHPDRVLSLSYLCRMTTWNLQGLKSGFTRVFGVSPHQYIIRFRMKLAVELLEGRPDLSIQAIALSCGYKRPHHFIEQFKIVYGKTPGTFRRDQLK
jgi:AraC-like DNA-binding protein